MTNLPKVALIGAGAMGGSLLRGWLEADSINKAGSVVFDPKPPAPMAELANKHGLALNPDEDIQADVAVLAVKPQIAAEALPAYAALARDAICVSIMAGLSVESIAQMLGNPKKIVRAMPNLPVSIGKGATGMYANDALTDADKQCVEKLMAVVGYAVWVESETDTDLVAAISGSGPAYFFHMVEALTEAGEALGLPKDIAGKLARTTAIGAGALLETDQRSAGDMRKAVTSPGGTTEAALGVIDGESQNLRKLMKSATEASAKRAGELSN